MTGTLHAVVHGADDCAPTVELPVLDFHQHPDRRQILEAHRTPTITITVHDADDGIRNLALLEHTESGWFLWRGPEGPPRADALVAILDACPHDVDVHLVLRPEWVDRAVLAERGWRLSAAWSTRRIEVDFEADDDAVLATMRASARSRVRRAIRAGARFVDDPSLLGEYYPVYADAMRRSGSPDFASEELLRDHLDRGHARLMLAVVDGAVAAGSVCLLHSDSLEARYVATHPDFRNSGPLHFVYFHAIRWAAERHLSSFDLSGMSPEIDDPKVAGINRFKASFGGSTFTYPIFTRRSATPT